MQNSVEALGMALRAARKKKKLTQRGLADKLHMSVRTIIAAESGNNNPKFETVALLAKELGLSLVHPKSVFRKQWWISSPARVMMRFKHIFLFVNKLNLSKIRSEFF